MIEYATEPHFEKMIDGSRLSCFHSDSNVDKDTIRAFKDEWNKFSVFENDQIESIGAEYFDLINQTGWNPTWEILDAGCGTGRWSRYVCKRVSFVEAIDPVAAEIAIAHNNDLKNLRVTEAGIDQIPFKDKSFDGAFCLGVLHHMPDTVAGLGKIVGKLKSGGWVLLYLYYALDNRSRAYKFLFGFSNIFRKLISRLPKLAKNFVCDLIAVFIYFPLVLVARLVKSMKGKYLSLPLAYYTDKSFYIMRNDARDRFGTPLEKRFRKEEIQTMMESAGLINIKFSDSQPYWCAVGYKA